MFNKSNTVQSLRVSIAQLQAERTHLIDGSRSVDEVRSYLLAYSTQQQAIAEELLRGRLQSVTQGESTYGLLIVQSVGTVDLGPVFAALLGPDALADALCRLVDIPAGTLDAKGRAMRLATVDAELSRLGRDEEGLIEQSEAAGTPIARRADADPACVLRI